MESRSASSSSITWTVCSSFIRPPPPRSTAGLGRKPIRKKPSAPPQSTRAWSRGGWNTALRSVLSTALLPHGEARGHHGGLEVHCGDQVFRPTPPCRRSIPSGFRRGGSGDRESHEAGMDRSIRVSAGRAASFRRLTRLREAPWRERRAQRAEGPPPQPRPRPRASRAGGFRHAVRPASWRSPVRGQSPSCHWP